MNTNKRKFDISLRTDFRVEARFGQGEYVIHRQDGVNWGLTGIDCSEKWNGSGPTSGPKKLVTKEQSRRYAEHVAWLWNIAPMVEKLVEVAEKFDALYQPDAINHMGAEQPNEQGIYGVNGAVITLGDFRNLREVLEKLKEEPKYD